MKAHCVHITFLKVFANYVTEQVIWFKKRATLQKRHVISISFEFCKIEGMFMGTIFVHHPCEDNTRQITNMLGQALQTFFIDLDVIGEEIITSKIYEQKKQQK